MRFYISRERGSLREGRATLWLTERTSLRWSWCFFDRRLSTAIGFSASGNDVQCMWHLALRWLFSLWFSIESQALVRWLGVDYESAKARESRQRASVIPARDVVPACYDIERRLELRFFDWGVWWNVWWRDDYTSSRDPRWRRGSWHYLDTLLGRQKYSEETLVEREVVIPMPEGTYPAKLKLDRDTWRRARWPWPRVVMRAKIDIPKGIPVPGKGDNSWDCGADATFGMTFPSSSVEHAIAHVVESCLKTRTRYGGALDYSERDCAPAELKGAE